MIPENPKSQKSFKFRERCKQECTRDVIFLLQRFRYTIVDEPSSDDGEYGYDGEGWLLGDTVNGFWTPREDSEYLSVDQLAEQDCLVSWWKTDSVWLTRQEAESYAKSREYNYSEGWRVYGARKKGETHEL